MSFPILEVFACCDKAGSFCSFFSLWLAIQFCQSAVSCPRSIIVTLCLGSLQLTLWWGIRSCSCYFVSGLSESPLSLLRWSSADLLLSVRGTQSFITIRLYGAMLSHPRLQSLNVTVSSPPVSSCHSASRTAWVFFPGCTLFVQ